MKSVSSFFCLFLLFPEIAISHGKEKVGLIFVGRTGAGKSTQIVGMHNLIRGKRYDEAKEFIIPIKNKNGETIKCNFGACTHSESGDDGSKSQTHGCNQYYVSNDKYDVTLIDTPGGADTDHSNGFARDKENASKIIDAIQSHSINAIVLVVPEGDNKLQAQVGYYVNELKKILTKESKNNFVVIITRTNEISEAPLQPLRTLGIPIIVGSNVFAFNFSSLFSYNPNSKKPQNAERLSWEENLQNIEDLLAYAAKLPVYESKQVKVLQKHRKELEHKMSHQIKLLEKLQNENADLSTYIRDIDEANERIMNNQDFILHEPYGIVENVPLSPGKKNTVCKSCRNVCHHDCSLSGIYTRMGDPELRHCHAMNSDGNCKYCGHPLSVHSHLTYKEVMVTKFKEVIIEPKKMVKEQAEATLKNLLQKKKESIESIKILTDKTIPAAYREIAKLYHQISGLALGFTNDYFLIYLDQIEENLRTADISTTERARKQEDIRRARMDYKNAELTIKNARDACTKKDSHLCQ